MKKKYGYTLAEVLISLGIIGFISAIMLPVINKVKPDPIKVMYLKTYDAITAATHELTSNTSAYPFNEKEENPQWDYSKAPLFNIMEVNVAGLEYGGNVAKYCQMLGASINTIDTHSEINSKCKTSTYTYNDSTFKNNISFTGTNGVQYLVSTTMGTERYKSDIYIDVNGDSGKNCMYNASTCKNPDRFHFIVAANGAILAADGVGTKYIEERKDWTKRSTKIATPASLENLISKLKPESIGPEPYYKNCEGYTANGRPVSCQGWLNPYNSTNKTPFIELHSNDPLKHDEFFYNPYNFPGTNTVAGVLMCKFPAGSIEAYCGTESLFLNDGAQAKLDQLGLTKDDLEMSGGFAMNSAHNRMYSYADDEFVRYNISNGAEVATWTNNPQGYISEIDSSYANGVYKGNSTVEDAKAAITDHLKYWNTTPSNNPELFDFLYN